MDGVPTAAITLPSNVGGRVLGLRVLPDDLQSPLGVIWENDRARFRFAFSQVHLVIYHVGFPKLFLQGLATRTFGNRAVIG